MRRSAATFTVAALLLAACSSAAPGGAPPTGTGVTHAAGTPATPSPTAALPPSPSPSPTVASEPTVAALGDAELAELGVNELGRVLVMEWHEIADTDDRWANSLATFKAQLQELCDRGYRPISVPEFVDGTFDVPAGMSPMVLTFDDSYKAHFFFAEDGETPHPDSAVGILEAMEQTCEGWQAKANFAFYWPVPFRETDPDLIARKLRYLVEHGYDLSNHTYNHDNLKELSDDEVQENLAKAEAELAAIVGDDYRVRSITLTQGIWPNNKDLAMAGEWDGFRYVHDIAFEVGFMPTRSPHHVDYDPRSVQRVQAYLPEFERWIAWLDEEPGRRLVSDGDPMTVTYPADWSDVAAPRPGLEVRTYPPASPASEG